MNVTNVEKVIQGSARKFMIKLEPEDETITSIIDHISLGKSGIQLSYLQVYLDRLYREAVNGAEYVTFKPDLVSKVGDIGGVLGEFLEQQIQTIQLELSDNFPDSNAQGVRKILGSFGSNYYQDMYEFDPDNSSRPWRQVKDFPGPGRVGFVSFSIEDRGCLLYTSPSPRDRG